MSDINLSSNSSKSSNREGLDYSKFDVESVMSSIDIFRNNFPEQLETYISSSMNFINKHNKILQDSECPEEIKIQFSKGVSEVRKYIITTCPEVEVSKLN